ncbi:actin-binding protein wsp1-like [Salvia miltiorrhiza]|uniref:actin-binding protein wsp1-like n=1 Tax=Salvia miltiorrhiza TaxID=226208 RepID=UPI0025AC01E8|nr:actin-binding protein wsp1-like [Salvia miltiorrhiza]
MDVRGACESPARHVDVARVPPDNHTATHAKEACDCLESRAVVHVACGLLTISVQIKVANLFQKQKPRHPHRWPPPPLLRHRTLQTPPPPPPQQQQDLYFFSPKLIKPYTRLVSLPIPTLITLNWPPVPPHPHPHPQDPSQLLYPLASSGRGFLRPVALPASRPAQRPPFMFPYLDQGQGNPVFVRPNHLPHVLIGSAPGTSGNAAATGAMPAVVKGIPVPSSHQPKVGLPSASISDNNGHKDSRDRTKDDAFVIIRDRKVRMHEKTSLYALCRSWLRNSSPEETQPQYLDTVKSLPRPLPVAAQDSDAPDKIAKDKEEDEDKDSCEHLSEKELLQRHIKRAKRVRSRLREERLQRITRYKTRLALLLPPMVEQHFKNESGPAN